MTPEEFDLRVGFPPEECESWNAPCDIEYVPLDPTLLGLPDTPANVEALRTARAMEDFKEEVLADETWRLTFFTHAAKSQIAEGHLAAAREKAKSNALAEALRVVADAARARGGKLWPEVRDAMMLSWETGKPLIGGLLVAGIEGRGFSDAHDKASLAGVTITFELADGTVKKLAAQTAYAYIMRK